jgi:hypothetical protein
MSDVIDPNIDPNTILYVDACVKRWQPFVKGMSKERQGFTSYLCEREANYLKERYEPMTPAERAAEGGILKWIFPILKRTCERIALGETEFDRLCEAAVATVEDMSEPVWCVWGMRDHGPPEEVKTDLLPPLMERAQTNLLAYEKIVSR